MQTRRIEEFKITKKQHSQIQTLLQICFSAYPNDRSFYKQIPSFRFLVFENKNLIGHLAIIHRMIRVGEENFTIFGVSDLCVHPDFQHKKIASALLQELELLGKKHNIDFVILIAQDQNFYKKNKYKPINNNCKWLIINDLQSLGLAKRNLENALMIKQLGEKKWQTGDIDFMGHIF